MRTAGVLGVVVGCVLVVAALTPSARTERARAMPSVVPQGQVESLGLSALCGGTVGCIAFVAAGITLACVYDSDYCAVTRIYDLRDSLLGEWGNGGAYVDDTVQQIAGHPGVLYADQSILDAWWNAYAALSSDGWTHSSVWGSLADPAWQSPEIGSVAVPASLYVTSTAFTLGTSSCAAGNGFQLVYNLLRGPTGGSASMGWDLDILKASDSTVLGGWASLPTFTTSSYTVTSSFENGGAGLCAAVSGQTVKLRVKVPHSGTLTAGHMWIADSQWVGIKQFWSDSTPDLINWTQAGEYADVVFAPGIPARPAAAVAVQTLVNPEDLIGWDGVTALPLADGTTANPVADAPTGTTGDTHWWEGLFGGVTDGLGAIKGVLTGIASGVVSIGANVAALPANIAALFDPSIAWADFVGSTVPASRAELEGVAPACWLTAVSSGTLMTGSGGDMSVDIGGVGGSTPVSVVIPYRPDVAAITVPLSQLLTAALVCVWGIRKLYVIAPDGTGSAPPSADL